MFHSGHVCAIIYTPISLKGVLMIKLVFACLVAGALCMLATGCTDVTEVKLTDEGEIASLIVELIWFNTKYIEGPEDTTNALGSPIVPLYWWREWDQEPPFDLNIQMNSERDSAFVTLSLDISGTLHNVALDTSMAVDTVDKAINDTALRYAIFLKDTLESYHSGWRLYKISGVEMNSDNVTVGVDSLRIRCSSYPDTIYSDPLALFALEDAFSFAPGEGVSLWVYANYDTAEVYFHSWKGSNWLRWQFTNQGGGVYLGVWSTPLDAQVYHSAFDILHHETLWDDQYMYDSNVWLMPYTVN